MRERGRQRERSLKNLFKKFNYPVLTNLRFKKIKNKYLTAKIKIFHIKKNDFYYNSIFNEKIIKYNKSYNNDQNSSKAFRDHLNIVLKIILKYFKKDNSIIEIGCGKGFFFKLLEKNFQKIRGFDSTYEGNNRNIKKRYINEKDIIKENLIILRHTLEHIPDHYNFLKLIKKISINNPYILIEVPDFNWIKINETFFDITYEHVNYFTKTTFKKLFNNKVKIRNVFNEQYLLIIAKINDLNLEYKKGIKEEEINFNKIFPNFKKKINEIKSIESNIYIWGAGSKGLMFLCILKYYSPVTLNKVKFVIDVDKKKVNSYLQIVNKLIISPQQMLKKINLNDTILVMNSNYLEEIKEYCDKRIFNKNIKYLTIDKIA